MKQEHIEDGVYDLHEETSSRESLSLHASGAAAFQNMKDAQDEMNAVLNAGPLQGAIAMSIQRRAEIPLEAEGVSEAVTTPLEVVGQNVLALAATHVVAAHTGTAGPAPHGGIGKTIEVFGLVYVVLMVLAISGLVGTAVQRRKLRRNEKHRGNIGTENESVLRVGKYSDNA